MDVLTYLTTAIILKYIYIQNHHMVHLKLTQYQSYLSTIGKNSLSDRSAVGGLSWRGQRLPCTFLPYLRFLHYLKQAARKEDWSPRSWSWSWEFKRTLKLKILKCTNTDSPFKISGLFFFFHTRPQPCIEDLMRLRIQAFLKFFHSCSKSWGWTLVVLP